MVHLSAVLKRRRAVGNFGKLPPRPKLATVGTFRGLPRYSLRSLLLVVTVTAILLGVWVREAAEQRALASLVGNSGGYVRYAFQEQGREARGTEWMRTTLGIDYFATIVGISWGPTTRDEDLASLEGLSELRRLDRMALKLL